MEVLIAAGLLSAIIFGTLKVLTISLQSSQVVEASFAEQELRIMINNILTNENECKSNFKPVSGKLTGTNQQKGIGTISQLTKGATTLLEKDTSFKNSLEIMKMELTGDASQDPKTQEVDREFIIYYSKKDAGKLSTLDGGTCTGIDTSGCYFLQCVINYRLENVASNPDVTTCDTLNCVGGDDVSCYTVDSDGPTINSTQNVDALGTSFFHRIQTPDSDKEGKGRTLIGCGGTSDIRTSTTTVIGHGAGSSLISAPGFDMTGEFNTFVGYEAGKNATTSANNSFFGFQAGWSNTEGSNNTFIGERAGFSNTEGCCSVFIGRRTGYLNTTGSDNIFLGNRAGAGNITGSDNTYLGRRAGYHTEDGGYNLFVGFEAGYINNTSGGPGPIKKGGKRFTHSSVPLPLHSTNTFASPDSSHNTFVGYQAGWSNTKGKLNTFIGAQTGLFNTTGSANIFVGDYAGRFNTIGDANVFLGRGAGFRNTEGDDNVFLGNRAGRESVDGDKNIYIGRKAGYLHTEGENNIFVGYEAGNPTAGITTTGINQLNIGHLIMGKLPSSRNSSPAIPSSAGAVIHGTLGVAKKMTVHSDGLLVGAGLTDLKGGLEVSGGFSCSGSGCPSTSIYASTSHTHGYASTSHTHGYASSGHSHSGYALSGHTHTPSSQVYKKNIKTFKNFEEAYEDIRKTPLFTYEYKEDHPNKKRMGFVSEELPEHLQIRDKGSPSMPDMPSIYGTFWAAIKALIIKFEDFKESTLSDLKKIKEQIRIVTNNLGAVRKSMTEKLQDLDLQIQQSMKESVEELTVQMATVKAAMEKKIDEVKTEVLQKIASIIKRVEGNTTAINSLNVQMKNTETNFQRLTNIEKKFSQQQMDSKEELKRVKAKLKENQKELNGTQERLKNMEVQVNRLLKLIPERR